MRKSGKWLLAAIVSLVLTIVSTLAWGQSVDDLTFMTEEYPPFNFSKDGTPQGITVDVLVLMLEKMGARKGRQDIKVVPWARGYDQIQKKPDICLFGMTYTDARKDLFKWVGPVVASTTSLIARKDSGIKISGISDLSKYKIGVGRSDVAEQILLEKGVPETALDASAKPISLMKKLNVKRIDIWAYDKVTAMYIIKDNGLNPGDFVEVYRIREGQMYYALSKQTPDAVVTALQSSLDALKQSGAYQKVLDRYLK